MSFGPNGILYIIDQGHTRIAMFDPKAETFTMWGTQGAGEGQFNESTGICIAENYVVVADTGNDRIQIFDLTGTFVRQWTVPAWLPVERNYPDVVYDPVAKRLYVSGGRTPEIFAYDLEGNAQTGFKPAGDESLDNPSSLAILNADKKRKLLVLNTGSQKLSAIDLEPDKKESKEPEKKESKPAKP